jgi:hypothetical protein
MRPASEFRDLQTELNNCRQLRRNEAESRQNVLGVAERLWVLKEGLREIKRRWPNAKDFIAHPLCREQWAIGPKDKVPEWWEKAEEWYKEAHRSLVHETTGTDLYLSSLDLDGVMEVIDSSERIGINQQVRNMHVSTAEGPVLEIFNWQDQTVDKSSGFLIRNNSATHEARSIQLLPVDLAPPVSGSTDNATFWTPDSIVTLRKDHGPELLITVISVPMARGPAELPRVSLYDVLLVTLKGKRDDRLNIGLTYEDRHKDTYISRHQLVIEGNTARALYVNTEKMFYAASADNV